MSVAYSFFEARKLDGGRQGYVCVVGDGVAGIEWCFNEIRRIV